DRGAGGPQGVPLPGDAREQVGPVQRQANTRVLVVRPPSPKEPRLMNSQEQSNRRDFLKASGAAALTAGLAATGVHAAGSDEIKAGLTGGGGGGRAAGDKVLPAAKNVTIWALGDAFDDRLSSCRRHLEGLREDDKVKELGNKVDVAGRTYTGLDAYKKVI